MIYYLNQSYFEKPSIASILSSIFGCDAFRKTYNGCGFIIPKFFSVKTNKPSIKNLDL